MSRVIKYRAFVKNYDGSTEMINDYLTLNEKNNHFEGSDLTNNYPFVLKVLDVMQFTGLTDKNGVEIFEGDIMQFKYYLAFRRWWSTISEIEKIEEDFRKQQNKVHIQKQEVVFYDGCFRINSQITINDIARKSLLKTTRGSNGDYEEKSFDFEVIGNIHQNKDLLNE